MEPLAESSDELGQLLRYGDDEMVRSVSRMTNEAAALVPDLVGLTLGMVAEGLVYTVVATDPQIAALDGVRYVDDGPCVRAMQTRQTVYLDHLSQLDEGEWRLFAQAGAAAGVKSTLSLPIVENDQVTGGVNLYGAQVGTFEQHAPRLAEIFGAWLPGAVSNGGLALSTRFAVQREPARSEELKTTGAAVEVLVKTHGITAEQARRHLTEAAARAGVPVLALALMILHDRG